MKRSDHECYRTIAPNGGHRLAAEGETLEELKNKIDASNERAVRLGYKAEQWIITHEERHFWYNDDGVFVKSEVIEEALEVYPAEL